MKGGVEMSNHGKVGNVLYVKYSPQKFFELSGDLYEDGYVISVEEFNSKYGAASCPIHIDSNTQGNYEVVCEYGVELH